MPEEVEIGENKNEFRPAVEKTNILNSMI